jgi:hypothetical protein
LFDFIGLAGKYLAVDFYLFGQEFMRVVDLGILFDVSLAHELVLVQHSVQLLVHLQNLVPHYPQLALDLAVCHTSVLVSVVALDEFDEGRLGRVGDFNVEGII